MSFASLSPPDGAPPETSTGSPVKRATRATVADAFKASGVERVAAVFYRIIAGCRRREFTIACAVLACCRSSGGDESTHRRRNTATTGIDGTSSSITPAKANARPVRESALAGRVPPRRSVTVRSVAAPGP